MQRPDRDGGVAGQGLHVQRGQMLVRPGQHRAQRIVAPSLGCQQVRELRLEAGAPGVQHQLRGHAIGQALAGVLLDHGQGHVDPGGDPGRGPHAAVAHEDGVSVDVQRGTKAGQA